MHDFHISSILNGNGVKVAFQEVSLPWEKATHLTDEEAEAHSGDLLKIII
jgi:hypothetical protein